MLMARYVDGFVMKRMAWAGFKPIVEAYHAP
jgi:hypothetical protein